MKLSVVIVNYNVQHFLEQCLNSVFKAAQALLTYNSSFETEVFVVDNNSVDGSISMLREQFQHVVLIENHDNVGFSKANNQAISIAKGEYILALNPDTLIEEDTFIKTINYLDKNKQIGGLGPKMIDGKGRFLAESKRALPTPWVAFYKIFGLSSLFPKSKKFGKYHLSYLPENEINDIEILAGAFMLMRKTVLNEIGYFDERFFMYGEDIDLSYRILLSGAKNVYFPDTTVIHYKGESTKKGSLNYVYIFYKAMKLFADKHFSKKYAKWYSRTINIAIYFRAVMSVGRRAFLGSVLPILDFLFLFLSFLLATEFWEIFKWSSDNYYPKVFKLEILPFYALFMLLGLAIKRNYKRIFRFKNLVSGLFVGGILLVLSYAFLNETLRFSRAVVLIGFLFSLIIIPFNRWLFTLLSFGKYQYYKFIQRKVIIVGNNKGIKHTESVLSHLMTQIFILGYISESKFSSKVVGDLSKIKEVVRVLKPNELIFCSGSYSASEIIQTIHLLANEDVQFKISPAKSEAIIGSQSIYAANNLVKLEADSLAKPAFRIQKRVFDIIFAFLLFIFSPIVVLFQKDKALFRNIISVILGKKTWVGFSEHEKLKFDIPYIKLGVINFKLKPLTEHGSDELSKENYLFYSKNYSLLNDLFIIFRAFSKLACNK